MEGNREPRNKTTKMSPPNDKINSKEKESSKKEC